ncbi:MAG: ABC transporter substrate-binding protein [Acidimicrobiales bacterium]
MTRFDAVPGRVWVAATVALLLLAPVACAGSSTTVGGSRAEGSLATTPADLLGAKRPASAEPVKVGFVTEGQATTVDTSDEERAAKATVAFLNDHRGGIGGRPIDLVTCDMKVDPAVAGDCANRLIAEGVVAVTLAQSTVTDALWKPLHAAGIPLIVLSGFSDALLADDQSTFVMVNPAAALFGLPVAAAKAANATRISFVVIDVPQATDLLEAKGPPIVKRAGLEYDIVRVPLGTADMTPQMRGVKDSGAGVVHVLGNDAFCIAAFKGLRDVGYTGSVSAVSQCLTDSTREALGAGLEGIGVQATLASGAVDDPTYQLFQAVMATYGSEVREPAGPYALGGYSAVATLAAALETIQGEVTPASVIDTIKHMPETPLPGGGGVTFKCGGSAMPGQPAICTNQWLRSTLDANGQSTSYTVEDSTDLLVG